LKIYLDDVRRAPDGYIWTRSVNETKDLIVQLEESGEKIEVLDLDHDLGEFSVDSGDAINLLDFLLGRINASFVFVARSEGDCQHQPQHNA
jgi:hypothetical protein